MGTDVMLERLRTVSPSLMARIAGVLYFVSVLTSVFNEFVVRGRLGFMGIVIPVSCQIVVTLLLYGIFRPVNSSVSFAASSQLVALTFEALEFEPPGGEPRHGISRIYCLLIGSMSPRTILAPASSGRGCRCCGFW